jgi:hypothetical protein
VSDSVAHTTCFLVDKAVPMRFSQHKQRKGSRPLGRSGSVRREAGPGHAVLSLNQCCVEFSTIHHFIFMAISPQDHSEQSVLRLCRRGRGSSQRRHDDISHITKRRTNRGRSDTRKCQPAHQQTRNNQTRKQQNSPLHPRQRHRDTAKRRGREAATHPRHHRDTPTPSRHEATTPRRDNAATPTPRRADAPT